MGSLGPEVPQAMKLALGVLQHHIAEKRNVKAHERRLSRPGRETESDPSILLVMSTPQRVAVGGLLGWARKRRFPTLLLITGGLFGLDLLVPDFIPLADELLLGLATLVLARWKDNRQTRARGQPSSRA